MLLYCFALLTPGVIGTEMPSDHFPNYDTNGYNNSSDDLIYLETGSFAITNVGNQINDIRLDINDFIGLIPVEEVRSVIGNYYRSDKEVQRAYTYLEDSGFLERLLNVSEIQNLVRYLNESGLDVVDAIRRTVDLIGDIRDFESSNSMQNGISSGNDTELTGGLHAMVDAILDVLPQDEILNMFFEKMDSNVQFMMFFSRIREPQFGSILHKLQGSVEMKQVVYNLHNHGIHVGKVIDSLKNYFFLGTF